ncbi:type II toxin-antitoxin system Phd/YefM family antitoxin [Salmonella enterica]|nr:type II toxin-antitoxin system Phd/YefM family antitoxin [Salmonella enterica]
MPNIILSDTSASVSELKKNPMATVSAGDGYPVAILNRNQPAFYCVPAELYEKMLDALDDQELVKLVAERSDQKLYDVDLDSYLVNAKIIGRFSPFLMSAIGH